MARAAAKAAAGIAAVTLFRQLFYGLSAIFLVALIGLQAIYMANAQIYLQQQLQSHAQDAATALGLSLPQAMAAGDRALAESVVNAAFDRGYFQLILVQSLDGQILVSKQLRAAESGVPAWFARLLPLYAPSGESLISSGWRQLGRVQVLSHPHFAYQQLWHGGIETLGWLLLVYAFALVAMRAFLATLLRPLSRIEATAAAISSRDYRTITEMPRSRELRRVVLAINALSAKVRQAIQAETGNAERFRSEAYHDSLTGLANRRGFEQQAEAWLTAGSGVHSGVLMLVELDGFAEFNRGAGYARGDEVLVHTARALANDDAQLLARVGGAAFACARANLDVAEAKAFVAAVHSRVRAVLSEQGIALHVRCGAVHFHGGSHTLAELLAGADQVLAAARATGADAFELQSLGAENVSADGSQQWKQRIEAALDERRLTIFAQTVIALPGRQILHREAMARLVGEDGELIAADKFLPMVLRHNLAAQLDLRILELLIVHLQATQGHFAVNVAAQSIRDASYVGHLRRLLGGSRDLAARLIFEMSEFGAMQDPAATRAFVAEIKLLGARFAIDNFGMQQDALRHLQSLLPDYIKLSARQIADLRENAGSRFFVAALARIAQTLDIGLIAQAVEDESLLPMLTELGFTGCQGYVSGRPERLTG
jgi:diguanylate cyclase (GGDEF)-like protein